MDVHQPDLFLSIDGQLRFSDCPLITPSTPIADCFLAGGGTKTKVTIAAPSPSSLSPSVQILATGAHRSSNCSDLGIQFAVESIGHATLQALAKLPSHYPATSWTFHQPAPFMKIWAGLSGVDSQADVVAMKAALGELFGLGPQDEKVLVISNDCDLLSGSIEFHYRRSIEISSSYKPCDGGIVLIAGTGSIATAYVPSSFSAIDVPRESLLKVAGRVGGYGYLLGDEGSAFDVGRFTVKAVLEAADAGELEVKLDRPLSSTIANSTLLPALLDHFGVHHVDDLLGAVYRLNKSAGQTEHDRKVRLAEVSRVVMRCAYPGDPSVVGDQFALEVMAQTAKKLSVLLHEVCRIHNLKPERLVLCLGGGMWAYEAYKETVLRLTAESWGAEWGWVESVKEPDQVAATTLVRRQFSRPLNEFFTLARARLPFSGQKAQARGDRRVWAGVGHPKLDQQMKDDSLEYIVSTEHGNYSKPTSLELASPQKALSACQAKRQDLELIVSVGPNAIASHVLVALSTLESRRLIFGGSVARRVLVYLMGAKGQNFLLRAALATSHTYP
ncbi:hypothetical protein CROQUDRAFT_96833 [Cronartium quercuum f. sp. fusiforme G11]|uniref:N-acetylglucosamine kinase n=1 Tax=Cronartium quercuum f. sp. fusiforme G11 TaxID=708437 RepID=A0A9P6T8W8_9BASI|nr:hypothetical protein CROQUDRAFT_96833 [Cronartium quercuum f. sp. fusiforme G11]